MRDEGVRTHARAASWLLLVSGVLALLGNLSHPMLGGEAGVGVVLREATAAAWVPIHVTLFLAIALLVAALVCLQRVIAAPGAALARIGAALAVLGGGMVAIAFGVIDGFATAEIAAEWSAVSGTQAELLETQAAALRVAEEGLVGLGTLLLSGLGLAAFGGAVLASGVLARWVGWITAVTGVLGVGVGLVLTLVGFSGFTVNALYRPLGGLATVVALVIGVQLRRVAAGPVQPQGNRAVGA